MRDEFVRYKLQPNGIYKFKDIKIKLF